MRRPKYHFLTVELFSTGKSVVTLPGQTFGLNPVPARQLVKDAPKSNAVSFARTTYRPGQILFTTTLKPTSRGLCATDVYPLFTHGSLLYQDAADVYESLYGPTT